MSNTQLPAEVVEEIKNKANSKYKEHGLIRMISRREGFMDGATEYATKLHTVEQENTQLKQWKKEAAELVNPIFSYGQSKEANIPLGESIINVILERCKKFDAARTLLEKFKSRHEAGLLPDRFIYDEIKTFLDGTK